MPINNDDCISREGAICTIKDLYIKCDTENMQDYRVLLLEAFDALPSADAVPVVHGKWIQFPTLMAYKCSECGRVIQTTDGRRNVSKHYPFCHCGADMRGDHHEG